MKTSWQSALQILYGLAGSSLEPCSLNRQIVAEFNSAIATCSRFHTAVPRAEQIFHGMQEVRMKLSQVTYNALISVYQKNSQVDKALGTLKDMETALLSPDVISYSTAISACEKGRMVHEAFQMFDEMTMVKRIAPNLISYSALISACEKSSCAAAAGETLSRLIADRLKPDVISFNAAIRAFAKVKDRTSATEILWKMKEHQVQPNVVSLNSLLSAYDAPGSKDDTTVNGEISDILTQMAAAAVRPNVVTFSTLINAHEKQSFWDLALADLNRMITLNLMPNRVAYTAALGACRRSENPLLMFTLYNDMRREMVQMDVVAYNALIAVCESGLASGRFLGKFGFAILQDMQESRINPDILSFNSLLNICRQLGDVGSAKMLYEQLLNQRLQADAITLNGVIETLEIAHASPEDVAELLSFLSQIGCTYLASLASQVNGRRTDRIR